MLFMTTIVKDMLWVFILLPRKGLFVFNFMPFTRGLWTGFVCHEKQFPGDRPTEKQMISA